jgi:hypothetical protein
MVGGVVVERQQHVKVVGYFRDSLGPLRAVEALERLGGPDGVVAVLELKISACASFAPGCADLGSAYCRLTTLCALCRRRHNIHCADLRIMPMWSLMLLQDSDRALLWSA